MSTVGKGLAMQHPSARGTRRGEGRGGADAALTDVLPALRPPRQSRSEESLAKMIRVGRDLIEQHGGFESVVISDVIRKAGTSTGAFYGRFKDKDAFIVSVLNAVFAELRADVDRWIAEDRVFATGTASDVAGSIVRYYVEMCGENRGMFKAVLRHFASRDPDANPMRWLDRHIREHVVPLLTGKLRNRRQPDLALKVEAAIQMVVGTLVVTLLTDPGPLHFDGDQLEVNLEEMMHRFLQLP